MDSTINQSIFFESEEDMKKKLPTKNLEDHQNSSIDFFLL